MVGLEVTWRPENVDVAVGLGLGILHQYILIQRRPLHPLAPSHVFPIRRTPVQSGLGEPL